jgi:hypothetical protein
MSRIQMRSSQILPSKKAQQKILVELSSSPANLVELRVFSILPILIFNIECNFQVSRNSFIGCQAQVKGGALFYDLYRPQGL